MKRQNFSKRKVALKIPDLSNVQLESFDWLLNEGINEVLAELGTVEDTSGRGWVLEFSNSRVEEPNVTLEKAFHDGRNYDAPWYLDATIKDTLTKKEKTQSIYMGDVPLITPSGTFVINGVERVIVNQLIRSEGILFDREVSPSTGRYLASAKVLPKNGVWLEFETSRTGVITVRMDRRRKMTATTLLRIFGMSTEEIRDVFKEVNNDPEIDYIEATLAKDPASNYDEACLEVYRKLRPGEPLVLENAKALVSETFFNPRRYSLGEVGRFKVNQPLELDFDPKDPKYWLLHREDIVKLVSYLIGLNNGEKQPSDVDHLGNRRVRRIGELLQNQIRIGFLRMERNIRERMTLQPREELPNPTVLISPRAVSASIHSFFATGRLSQFQDQQNPLTSLAHLRRLSVLGPGGLTRERASMAVRDVHYSSFGRICPVRTPEGPNIGLINYLSMYARVNDYGFLETPYVKLEKTSDGKVKVTDKVEYLAAYQEENMGITDASITIDDKGFIKDKQVPIRRGGDFTLGPVTEAEYMEVVPMQIVGISAGLIPFLSNDDISRALMGTQQMSQAVPLVNAESPIVATGIEEAVAENSGAVVKASGDGIVVYADGAKIEINYEGKRSNSEYFPAKFVKSNLDTSYNQVVKVETGQKVKKGDVLFEGPAVDKGDLSIGTNVKVAYMIWEGYEFEDGIVISDRLVKDDVLTSIHIADYLVKVLETKLGPEEVTADVPNVSEETLRNLTEDGIVAVGSEVHSGDVLVGKVAPKGEPDLSAEERLLRAIFGEKAKDVRDNSLRMPHGTKGTVINVKRVSKEDNEDLPAGVIEEITVYVAERRKISIGDKLAGRHGNKGVISAIVPEADMPHLEDGSSVDVIFSSEAVIKRMNVGQIQEALLGLAGLKLGKKYTVPPLEPVSEEQVEAELREAGLPVSGKMKLIDGRTGEPFENEVVVGQTYLLKLIHMSEEKMHSRSTGPYSLITQQPLGGKAQFGGQRFGEMEVWALEAYGAAHTLQEMLTIKSDDLVGRTRAYSAIIQGEAIPEATVPETFKLLVRQLNGLGIGLETVTYDEGVESDVTEEVEPEDENGEVSSEEVADDSAEAGDTGGAEETVEDAAKEDSQEEKVEEEKE